MANFKYKAISTSGEPVNGVIEATDQMAAVAKIKQTCSIIVEIQEVQGPEIDFKPRGKRIDAKLLSLMCDRFAIILGVGLPIVKADGRQGTSGNSEKSIPGRSHGTYPFFEL